MHDGDRRPHRPMNQRSACLATPARDMDSLIEHPNVFTRTITMRPASDLQISRPLATSSQTTPCATPPCVIVQYASAFRIAEYHMSHENFLQWDYENVTNNTYEWFCVGQAVTSYPYGYPDLYVQLQSAKLGSVQSHGWISDFGRATLTMSFVLTLTLNGDNDGNSQVNEKYRILAACTRTQLRVLTTTKRPVAFTDTERKHHAASTMRSADIRIQRLSIPVVQRMKGLSKESTRIQETQAEWSTSLITASMCNFALHVDHAVIAEVLSDAIYEELGHVVPSSKLPTTLHIQYIAAPPRNQRDCQVVFLWQQKYDGIMKLYAKRVPNYGRTNVDVSPICVAIGRIEVVLDQGRTDSIVSRL